MSKTTGVKNLTTLLEKQITIFQVDLAEVKYLTKIATQCRGRYVYCVSTYYVKVKDAADGDYTAVCGTDSCPQLFTGNEDAVDVNAVVTNEFDWPIAARFVRLNPQSWIGWISLRWELYGCD